MSYNNYCSNEFQSEYYNNLSENYNIQHATLNDLIRISRDSNIKALRQYIVLHKRDLKCYKIRLLSNIIPHNGYKSIRRDDKLMIINIVVHDVSCFVSLATNNSSIVDNTTTQKITTNY